MKLANTSLFGVHILEQNVYGDSRGSFMKIYQKSFLEDCGLDSDFRENYYSTSRRNVVRGMHFQIPPFEHAKIVTVIGGKILDVVLDMREGSPTYGMHEAFELSSDSGKSIYIPKGCAHGFAALSELAITHYLVGTEHNAECDKGILWNSFGFDWRVTSPILSERDLEFPAFAEFRTPFRI